MDKKTIKNQKHISMELFLRDYCNIPNEELISQLSELSHRELKMVCKEVYGIELLSVPFETISQPDLNSGDILLVKDHYRNPAPYINPLKKKEQSVVEEYVPRIIRDDMLDIEEIIDMLEENMTIPDVDVSTIGSFTLTKRKGR